MFKQTPVHLAALSAASSGLPLHSGSMAVELRAADVVAGAPKRIKLLPEGEFASWDGRPGSMENCTAKSWVLTPALGAALVARFNSIKKKMLIDYEHQTLRVAQNGLPNPAAAWISALSYLPDGPGGPGLYGDVAWTAKAAALVASGEYVYLSPVFLFDFASGEVLALLHAAITNDPGLNTDSLPELQAQLSAMAASQFSTMPKLQSDPGDFNPPQEPPMKLLLAALGLSAVASEEAGMTALNALQSQVQTKDAQIVELSAKQFDPAKHIPLTEHTKVADQLAALTAQSEKLEVEQLMTAMLADSRILPANADYWKAQPLAALKAFSAVAKPLAAALTASQTGGQAPAGNGQLAALSAEDKAVCEQLGLKPEDYLKNKAVATA